MCAAVGANQASAVNGEAHGQILDSDIMHDLVISTLQEGGIDRAEWTHSLRGKASGKGHCMLFGDTHIERAFGVCCGEFVDARAAGHSRGDGANFRVRFRKLRERCAKDILI